MTLTPCRRDGIADAIAEILRLTSRDQIIDHHNTGVKVLPNTGTRILVRNTDIAGFALGAGTIGSNVAVIAKPIENDDGSRSWECHGWPASVSAGILTVKPADSACTVTGITLNGAEVPSAAIHTLSPVKPGSNRVEIVVQAEDRVHTERHILWINRNIPQGSLDQTKV